jgi:predicted nucleic acid binding AN1-type Zn finger protein
MSNIDAYQLEIVVWSDKPSEEPSFFITDDDYENNNEQKNIINNSVNVVPKKKRCSGCNKKLALASEFICKCNGIFCNKHRYPDMHNCTFDHKGEWSKSIQAKNPHVINEKLSKI